MKIRYVQRVSGEGKTRLYFRKGDYREGPLSSDDGSEALALEVAAILRKLEAAAKAARSPRPNTVGGMLAAYNRSAEFLALARLTQRGYQGYIDEMKVDIGDVLLSEVSQAFLRAFRDALAVRGHRAANMRMQLLKNALAPAIDDQADMRIQGDPFAKLAKVKRPHDAGEAHPIWTDEEVEAAIEEAIARKQPGLARAIALGRWGGFRRKTICALPLTARVFGHASNGLAQVRLHWITEKKKVACDKREDPRLTALLDRTPDAAATIAYNADGHPFKERQLNQAINRLLLRLGTTGQVRTVTDSSGKLACPLDIHGLRHARGTEIALAGGSDAEIMTQLEHATDRAAKIYRRQADRRRMADAAQDRIDEAIERQTARKTLSPEQRAQPGTVKPGVKEL
ncbi:site-specific integrase [Brevundimonas sp. KM4]|uniref:site-specific integrase n=1 Tax=Brevundimonas sp. KM4 TaxID=1628191 RepID=UPI000B1575B2|nr:site-specific integrase [Brevundimonas sp. KM4]